MTDAHTAPSPSESVSTFAIGWLAVAVTLGVLVFVLITFRLPILAAVKSVFPYIDVI
jgi:hypothetical protein